MPVCAQSRRAVQTRAAGLPTPAAPRDRRACTGRPRGAVRPAHQHPLACKLGPLWHGDAGLASACGAQLRFATTMALQAAWARSRPAKEAAPPQPISAAARTYSRRQGKRRRSGTRAGGAETPPQAAAAAARMATTPPTLPAAAQSRSPPRCDSPLRSGTSLDFEAVAMVSRPGWVPVPAVCCSDSGTLKDEWKRLAAPPASPSAAGTASGPGGGSVPREAASLPSAADPDRWFREQGINPYSALGLTLDTAGALTGSGRALGAAPTAAATAGAPAPRALQGSRRRGPTQKRQALLPVVNMLTGARPARRCPDCGADAGPAGDDLAAAQHRAVCPARPNDAAPRAGATLAALPVVARSAAGANVVAVSLRAATGRLLDRAADMLALLESAMGTRVEASAESELLPAPAAEEVVTRSRGRVARHEAGLTLLVCTMPAAPSGATAGAPAVASAARVVVGLATSEPISGARLIGHCDVARADAPAAASARVGIRQVWVRPGMRRRGLGGLLFRAAQLATLGAPVGREALAVSSPTISGSALARAVLGRPDFPVYGSGRAGE